MLEYSDWKDEGTELASGETRRICHTNCSAGEDTRYRLYITRPAADETKLIAYCHNCQEGGAYIDDGYAGYRDGKHKNPGNKYSTQETVRPPSHMIADMRDWPTQAQAWAMKGGLYWEQAHRFGIKYDPNSNRVYLPRFNNWTHRVRKNQDNERDLLGYQLRALDAQGPKYITVARKDAPGWTFIDSASPDSGHTVIVEDLLSGIKVLEEFDLISVYVNHSVRVDPTMCYQVARNYSAATVWFDNDGRHVIEQARLMQRTMQLYNDELRARVVDPQYSDPKHYDGADVRRIIEETWLG